MFVVNMHSSRAGRLTNLRDVLRQVHQVRCTSDHLHINGSWGAAAAVTTATAAAVAAVNSRAYREKEEPRSTDNLSAYRHPNGRAGATAALGRRRRRKREEMRREGWGSGRWSKDRTNVETTDLWYETETMLNAPPLALLTFRDPTTWNTSSSFSIEISVRAERRYFNQSVRLARAVLSIATKWPQLIEIVAIYSRGIWFWSKNRK